MYGIGLVFAVVALATEILLKEKNRKQLKRILSHQKLLEKQRKTFEDILWISKSVNIWKKEKIICINYIYKIHESQIWL